MGCSLRAVVLMTYQIHFVNLRDAPDVSIQPEAILNNWRIFERHLNGGVARHISGWPVGSTSLRMSSPIVEIDIHGRVVTTSSGRRYLRQSPQTGDSLLIQLIAANARQNGLGPEATDISDALWSEILKVTH